MKIENSPLKDLMVIETEEYNDHRGAFIRLFCQDVMKEILGHRTIVQVNHTRTTAIGAVRGLHFQHPPFAEMKFIRCLAGRVWDVAVDIRRGSPTFLQWHAEILSKENKRMVVIPEGLAHGFQVLEKESELLYLHTAFYTPEAEGGIQPTDKKVGIDWPLKIQDLSERDNSQPLLTSDFSGLKT